MDIKLKNIIDSHCHFNEMVKKGMNSEEIIKTSFANGMEACLDIGIAADDILQRIRFKKDGIYFAAGIYPSYSEGDYSAEVEKLEQNIIDMREDIAVIGECGLDFYRNISDKAAQIDLLDMQIDLANKYDLPVAIHCREAEDVMIDYFSQKKLNKQGIVHCFSSNKDYAKKFVDFGFKISFAGNLTYKKSYDIQEACKFLSLEDILFETDSPYLSPQVVRGTLNSPPNVYYTYEFASELKGVSMEELSESVKANFYNVVKKKF